MSLSFNFDRLLDGGGLQADDQDTIRGIPSTILIENDLGTYDGMNSFGAKTKVAKSLSNRFQLFFLNPKAWSYEYHNDTETSYKPYAGSDKLTIKATVPIEEARKEKDQLRVIAVFRTSYPYTGKSSEHFAPSVRSPIDLENVHSLVSAEVESFWLYNLKTGKVYAKVVPEPAKSE